MDRWMAKDIIQTRNVKTGRSPMNQSKVLFLNIVFTIFLGTFDRSKFTDSAPNDDVKQLDLEKVVAYDAAHLEGRLIENMVFL